MTPPIEGSGTRIAAMGLELVVDALSATATGFDSYDLSGLRSKNFFKVEFPGRALVLGQEREVIAQATHSFKLSGGRSLHEILPPVRGVLGSKEWEPDRNKARIFDMFGILYVEDFCQPAKLHLPRKELGPTKIRIENVHRDWVFEGYDRGDATDWESLRRTVFTIGALPSEVLKRAFEKDRFLLVVKNLGFKAALPAVALISKRLEDIAVQNVSLSNIGDIIQGFKELETPTLEFSYY